MDRGYEFKMKHHDGTEIIYRGDKECLADVVDDFKHFLLAVGYHPNNLIDYLRGADDEPY